MATLLRDGFDFYSAVSQTVGNFSSMNGNCSLSASTRFSHGQSLQTATTGLNNTLMWSKAIGFNTGDTVWFNFAVRKPAAVNADNLDRFKLLDGGTVQCSFRITSAGAIEFYRGDIATLLATYAGAFVAGGVWQHFQIKIRIHNTLGSIEVRRDGSDFNDFELIGTGGTPLDTQTTANAYANSIDCNLAVQNPEARQYDDLWIFDNTIVAGEPSDWIGDVRAWQIMPNSDSSVALSRSAGATNFSNVDEAIQSSVDYVFGASPGLTDEYGNPGFAVPLPTDIFGLSVKMASLKLDAGPRMVGVRVRSGATVSDSAGIAPSTSVRTDAIEYDLNPDTGLAWTAAEIAAMTFGPRIVT